MSAATFGLNGQQLHYKEVDALPLVQSYHLAVFLACDRAAICLVITKLLPFFTVWIMEAMSIVTLMSLKTLVGKLSSM